MNKQAITDRLNYAIRILEGAVECQVSVDGLVLASEAIDKLKTCENRG